MLYSKKATKVHVTIKRVYWESSSGAIKLILGASAESEGFIKFPRATSSPLEYLISNKVKGENPSGTTKIRTRIKRENLVQINTYCLAWFLPSLRHSKYSYQM
jgi:hypothetical protein